MEKIKKKKKKKNNKETKLSFCVPGESHCKHLIVWPLFMNVRV